MSHDPQSPTDAADFDDDDFEEEPPICPECNGRGYDMEGSPCDMCDGDGYADWL